MEVKQAIIPNWKCHENEEKIDNDYVLRNDHRIKTTQPFAMILVSFFLEDNVLSDEIKICYIFECQSNESPAFPFFGTPGISTLSQELAFLIWVNYYKIARPRSNRVVSVIDPAEIIVITLHDFESEY